MFLFRALSGRENKPKFYFPKLPSLAAPIARLTISSKGLWASLSADKKGMTCFALRVCTKRDTSWSSDHG